MNKPKTPDNLKPQVDEARARAWFSEFGPGEVGFTEMRDVVIAALAAQQGDASRSCDDSSD